MNKEEEAEFKRKMDVIWRCLYGEKDNEVKGMVDEVKVLKDESKKTIETQKKYIYKATGFIAAIAIIYELIKEFHIKLF